MGRMIAQLFAEMLRYRALLWNLVRRDLVVRYKRSFLGFFWAALNPVIHTVVYSVVFSTVFRFETRTYVVYFLSGYLIWSFFAMTTTVACRCVVANVSLFNKIYVPKAVFVFSALLSGLINFGLTLMPLLVLLPIVGIQWQPALLFLPIAVLFTVMFTLGISLLLASVTVFFHDVGEMYQVILMPWMFLTPIVYPVEIIPAQFMPLVKMNPWFFLLQCFREPIYTGQIPDAASLLLAAALSVATLLVGCGVFARLSDRFLYYI